MDIVDPAMAMLRLAGLYGVLFFGLVIGATILGAPVTSGAHDVARGADSPEIQRWSEHGTEVGTALWLWVFAFLMLGGFTVHLLHAHGERSRDIAMSAMLLGASALVATLAAILMFGIAREAAPYIVANELNEGHPFVQTTAMLVGSVRMAYLLASLLAALGVILLGVGLLPGSGGLHRGFAVACLVFGIGAAADVLLDLGSRHATGPGSLEFTVGALIAVRGGIDTWLELRQMVHARAALRAIPG